MVEKVVKILAEDRESGKQFNVSAYKVAQSRELGELAISEHPLSADAVQAMSAIFDGSMSMSEGYRLVKNARGGSRTLLSAQIDADVLWELKSLAKQRKQLFRDFVEEMANVYLLASWEEEECTR